MDQETTTSLIDTALASGSASALDPEERRVQELVLTIRDDAPSPDADFKLRMDARVAAGFPRRRAASGGLLRALLTTRPQLAAMGATASLLIALIVALGISSGPSDSTSSSSTAARAPASSDAGGGSASNGSAAAGSTTGAATDQAAPAAPAPSVSAKSAPSAGSVTETSIAPMPPVPSPGFVGGRNRKVERNAALVLAPDKDKLSEVGDQVIAVTDRYRGFVMRSSVTSATDQGSGGSFDLRVPVRNLRPALRDLSALADVKSRTENADDVTASFVSARTRLEELQAERRGLLRRLEKATTDQQSSAIRARIRIVNAQIQSQMSVLAEMRRRTSYASVSVTLEPKAKDSGSGGGGIGNGVHDLRDSLINAANIALRVLGVALPIALLVALLWVGGGWFNRRRREAILD